MINSKWDESIELHVRFYDYNVLKTFPTVAMSWNYHGEFNCRLILPLLNMPRTKGAIKTIFFTDFLFNIILEEWYAIRWIIVIVWRALELKIQTSVPMNEAHKFRPDSRQS